MSFFKRLSRGSRSNSYVEDDYLPQESPRDREKHTFHDSSPRQSTSQHNTLSHNYAAGHNDSPPETRAGLQDRQGSSRDGMLYQQQQTSSRVPQEPYALSRGGQQLVNGTRNVDSIGAASINGGPAKSFTAPDLLQQAFMEAVKPHTQRVEQLEQQVQDLQAWVNELEKQRAELHAWIDKRGLRPDVPASVAKILDQQPNAAPDLNAQLDRKITIVNFDLHRLQDDLNDSISSSHFASAMAKFLPDIARLSSLPTGPRYAFDLILKLGGNLNAHGGLDASDPADLTARRDFYAKLDTAMVEVVRRRFQESEDWPVSREIKRIEKTAAYLRNFGVEPYFPFTLEAMRREVDFRGPSGANTASGGVAGTSGGQHSGAGASNPMPVAHSPPRYAQ